MLTVFNSAKSNLSHCEDSIYTKKSSTTIEKTKQIVGNIFKSCYQVISFPLRYLGSKTWSIGGVIARTFLRSGPIFSEQGYHYHTQKKLTPEDLLPYLKYAATSASSFKDDPKWLEGFNLQFHNLDPQEIAFIKGIHSQINIQGAVLFDPNTGLKALIVENEDEVCINFGARDSLTHNLETSDQQKQAKNNQSTNVILNFAGFTPDIYEQAASLVTTVQMLPQLKNKKLTLVGQSFGAGLAQYVGIRKEIPAICFNSISLGAGLQNKLGQKALAKSDNFITHISVETDIFCDPPLFLKFVDRFLGLIGIRTPGNFGQRLSIPSAYSKMHETHTYVLGSVMKHLGYNSRSLPKEAISR